MVEGLPGAAGAVFADQEGESVVCIPRSLDKYELQVIGAYAGIFLSQIRRVCTDIEFGAAQHLKLECRNSTLLISDLRDGYYLVLVLHPGANEAVASVRLEDARQRLVAEL